MAEASNQQIETTVQMDDTASGADMEVPNMDDGPSGETPSSSGDLTASCPAFLLRILTIFSCCSSDNKSEIVPRTTGYLTNEIKEFIPGGRRYFENIFGKVLYAGTEEWFRQSLPVWNTFLQLEQGARDTSASISSNIHENINEFILRLQEERGEQLTEHEKKLIKAWLPDWNMFLQARAEHVI